MAEQCQRDWVGPPYLWLRQFRNRTASVECTARANNEVGRAAIFQGTKPTHFPVIQGRAWFRWYIRNEAPLESLSLAIQAVPYIYFGPYTQRSTLNSYQPRTHQAAMIKCGISACRLLRPAIRVLWGVCGVVGGGWLLFPEFSAVGCGPSFFFCFSLVY